MHEAFCVLHPHRRKMAGNNHGDLGTYVALPFVQARMSTSARAIAAALGLATALLAGPAMADDGLRLNVDWAKLEPVLRFGPAALFPSEFDRLDAADPTGPMPWLGSSPRVSLVARDWGASQRLFGRLALVDQMRPTQSSRMIVSRLRISDGRIAPFAQVGLGEWRVDTSVVPTFRTDRAFAGQAGAGLELQMSPEAVVALEADWTLLRTEDEAMSATTQPTLWGVFIASRTRF